MDTFVHLESSSKALIDQRQLFHDLRNSAQSILLALDILEQSEAIEDDPQAQKAVKTIAKANKNCIEIVKQLDPS